MIGDRVARQPILDSRSSILDQNLLFGQNTLQRLGDVVRALEGRRVLLVTDPGITKAGHEERAVEILRKSSIETVVFQEVAENPTTEHVENGAAFARETGPFDLIIGLGGGSAMDCAKGINFLLTNGGKMEDYRGFGKASKPLLPAIGIPTTAGTGSEAQSFALISKADTHEKMACGDPKARFKAVILDPALVRSAPRPVRAVTGMDAISHAVESYVCTKRNPVSQMFAREAWWLLASNYETVLSAPDNRDALAKMLMGAYFAGAAIEHSMLGAAHACANPLTARFGITHGMAVGLMLPHVVRFNGETVNTAYGELLEPLRQTRQSDDSASKLAAKLEALNKGNDWPERLRDLQVGESDLPHLAEEAASQWTGQFNPRKVGRVEFLDLYRAAY